ncbi:2-oxoacid:ferredoxin oxidoreductase subunit beta [Exilibacterium tricleocarpae]|uniref:2-oxoacid:ferredoxin oxidoreductase subunit beta n=1 Tax=Exilibacterium tricleocarpae TaxID=2591008 RepID=A0A545TS22_9GAMM|nr:2-oxoacid:ferredoxin oxidoreductase subunit beta [Exilibacterium tricleocarpae]TQV80028.1 2-oxoacid:ferredoxin oxidoreductase subunit beta [Exilibacterium tricleocarpae]
MSYIPKPSFRHPQLPVNDLGLTVRDYEGALSTLCAGCGHDSISSAVMQACHQMALEPYRVAKMSGIGCSSKTPNYFLNQAHGFNAVHGRMPSVTTGANLANRDLIYIGMSGDGDTASIGIGQFIHAVRRRLNMVYIVANNGTYGLTKGQNSATADRGSLAKKGSANPWDNVDLVTMAIQAGAGFVARSFSGDKAQLVPLLQAAIAHNGFAFIDCISPCVTFNNHRGSTKSFDYVREHNTALNRTDFIPMKEEITADYQPGEFTDVCLHDGSVMRLHKMAADGAAGYDPQDRVAALDHIQRRSAAGEVLTGLLYLEPNAPDMHEVMETAEQPLNQLGERELCPGREVLQTINASFR